MKKLIFSIAFLSSVIFLNACYDDNEETLYRFSQSSCDTSNVTYSSLIVPIFQSSCISCHSGSSPSGNLNLSTHGNIVSAVNSKNLYARITSTSNPMPPSGLMDGCKIKQVKKWIDSNMPNN